MIHEGKLKIKIISLFGSQEQKAFYFPKIISGEIFSSICLTEPEFGSNAASDVIRISEFDKKFLLLKGKKRLVIPVWLVF
jgi:alkylation response protein AidB-like acyl-CoA dehydrogenase